MPKAENFKTETCNQPQFHRSSENPEQAAVVDAQLLNIVYDVCQVGTNIYQSWQLLQAMI